MNVWGCLPGFSSVVSRKRSDGVRVGAGVLVGPNVAVAVLVGVSVGVGVDVGVTVGVGVGDLVLSRFIKKVEYTVVVIIVIIRSRDITIFFDEGVNLDKLCI